MNIRTTAALLAAAIALAGPNVLSAAPDYSTGSQQIASIIRAAK